MGLGCLSSHDRAIRDNASFSELIHSSPALVVTLCIQASQAPSGQSQRGAGVLRTGVKAQPTNLPGQTVVGTEIGNKAYSFTHQVGVSGELFHSMGPPPGPGPSVREQCSLGRHRQPLGLVLLCDMGPRCGRGSKGETEPQEWGVRD